MTATERPADRVSTLRQVADMIRADHGRCCDNHAVWAEIAGWLGCVAIDEEWGEPETATRVRERTTALGVAEAYLSGQKART